MNTSKDKSQGGGSWKGDLPVTSRYTFGLAGERFYRAIQNEGKILGTRCEKCQRTYVPAAMFCERCFTELDSWIDVGTTGKVHTFTLLHQDLDGKHQEEPEIVALVQLGDGGLIHRLGEIEADQVVIGLEVEAVFLPESDRHGAIQDIKYFRPIS